MQAHSQHARMAKQARGSPSKLYRAPMLNECLPLPLVGHPGACLHAATMSAHAARCHLHVYGSLQVMRSSQPWMRLLNMFRQWSYEGARIADWPCGAIATHVVHTSAPERAGQLVFIHYNHCQHCVAAHMLSHPSSRHGRRAPQSPVQVVLASGCQVPSSRPDSSEESNLRASCPFLARRASAVAYRCNCQVCFST